MVINFIIPGQPIAKRRPRFARRGKFVVTYSDQETEEGRFLVSIREQWKNPPTISPLSLRATFYVLIPKSTSQKKRKLMLEGVLKPNKTPDLDNLIKFFLDVLNEEVWRDDSQIISLWAEKKFTENPRTEIEITTFP